MTTGFVKSTKENARKVYLAGDCLNRGAQLQRAEEREAIKALGHQLYNPMDNKDINDKKNAVQEGLAERIVKQDTDAIIWSDTVVIEPLVHAVGTCVELGQIKGMRDVAKEIMAIMEDLDTEYEYEDDYNIAKDVALDNIYSLCYKHINRKVLPHNSDVRRHNTSPQSGDRREYGAHQYVLGVCLDLTEGKGFYEMDEIMEELK